MPPPPSQADPSLASLAAEALIEAIADVHHGLAITVLPGTTAGPTGIQPQPGQRLDPWDPPGLFPLASHQHGPAGSPPGLPDGDTHASLGGRPSSWTGSDADCDLGLAERSVAADTPTSFIGASTEWSAGSAAVSPDSGEASFNRLAALALALLERPWDAAERETIRRAADALRRRLAGDTVSYVINRNLNSSNVCVLRCGFCAFRRDEGQDGAYRHGSAELCERAREAHRLGATELCLQAALDPSARLGGSHLAWAEALLGDLAAAAPGIHLHAFSPQELLFFAQADGLSLDTVLTRLRQAGLGSVPGTAAEVLSERIRQVICPEKLSARAWVTVMLQLQRHGLPATSTLMAGHVEQPADRVAHLLTLVALQRRACQHRCRGFSEFVLLPFIGASAPAPLRRRVGRDQPDAEAMLLLTAQARLLLGPWFPHHQPSWVKLTLPQAVEALRWGCDDIGGTLMEEHITTMAGASGGTAQTPAALRRAVTAIGRPLRQRTTLYGHLSGAADPAMAAATATRAEASDQFSEGHLS